MDNTTHAATWNDITRKSAVGVTRAQVILVAAPLFLYVNAYDVIRLLLLEESAAILASLVDGMLVLAAFLSYSLFSRRFLWGDGQKRVRSPSTWGSCQLGIVSSVRL